MIKSLLFIIILLSAVNLVAAQTKSDRESGGLKGPVKSISEADAEYTLDQRKLVEGERELSSTSQYDEIGRLLSRTSFSSSDKKGEILYKTSYQYDGAGRLIETTTAHSKFTYLADKKTYSYDEKGRLKEEKGFDVSGKLLGGYTYTYDSAGNAIEERSSGIDKLYYGEWLKKRRYDVDRRVIEEASYREEGGKLVPYDFRLGYYKQLNLYDSRGRKVVTNFIGTDERTYRTRATIFDDKDNELETTTFHTDGTVVSRQSYAYEFDQYGNPIKEVSSVWTTEDGKSFFRPKEVTYSTITYFAISDNAAQNASRDATLPVLQNNGLEEYAVYRAILGQQSTDALVIQRFTEGYNTDDPEKRASMTVANFLLAGLAQATIDDYVAKNQNRQYELLKDEFGLKRRVELVSQNELTALFAKNCERGWREFYRKYPRSKGYTTISRVGFSADGTEALVYVSSAGGCLRGSGSFVIMAKQGGVWTVRTSRMIWTS